ncbi:MFS general substrate transporter [Aspergillus terreus]|uniref:MFS general substrate transporter n=1 Tax=Aspergillus terreus TaxID=33178 RepID=A0A5M3ZA51_ASPTE|nr:hypothetical protein ATETN484_0012034000 [Aspergillus terreus]GFF19588.1 MFS general substrate transporter [Aspergillus terreus]
MAGGMIQLATFFNRPLSDITYSNGATLICQGLGTLLWMPMAVKFGRRPVYLASNTLMGIACVWLAIAAQENYPLFVVARVFLGLFEAPIEAIVPSTVADIFYLHERGEKISLYGLSVLGGNELGPLASAYIIQSLSMRWAFFITAMSIGVSLITMFFFMPETMFNGPRPAIVPVNAEETNEIHESEDKLSCEHIEGVTSMNTAPVELESSNRKKRSYTNELFQFGINHHGLVFISPLLGSLAGTYLAGPLADQIATWFTARNQGVREPEMRLPTCIVAAVLTFVGALIAGLTYHYQTHWAGPIVGLGVLSAGAQMGATLAITYSLDCHKALSAEIMVTISCLRSSVAWVWTWCINDWITSSGLLAVFMSVAAINVAVYLTTVILHLYGKKIRIWLHKKDFMGEESESQ